MIARRQCHYCNASSVQQTYPHVDMPEVGVKAAKQLLALMSDTSASIAPKLLRVRIPALVRR